LPTARTEVLILFKGRTTTGARLSTRVTGSYCVTPTQCEHLLLNLIVEHYEGVNSVELTQDLHGVLFELLTEFGIVFLIDLPRLKIKIEITNRSIHHLFLEQEMFSFVVTLTALWTI
jgi:hypothetical protein